MPAMPIASSGLAVLRRRLNKSQSELASAVEQSCCGGKKVAISQSSISRAENGERLEVDTENQIVAFLSAALRMSQKAVREEIGWSGGKR